MAYTWGTSQCRCAGCEAELLAMIEMGPLADELTSDFFKANVARGAGFLDRVLGAPEWRPQVNPAWLRLESNNRCVLGQVYGHYVTGVEQLGLSAYQEIRFGFQVPTPIQHAHANSWEALTEAWRRELTPA